VRAAFLQLAETDPDNWVVIDATASIDDVSRSIRTAVEARLAAFSGGGKPT
jgi:dTMP kinase